MNKARNLLIKRLVSLESEAMYKETEEMGMLAKQNLERAQMKKLQNLAYSSNKVVDIFDYIKNQTGKDNRQMNWAKASLGEKFLKKLVGLKSKRDNLVEKLQGQNFEVNDFDRQKIYLELCREFIRHTVAQYLYGKEVQG